MNKSYFILTGLVLAMLVLSACDDSGNDGSSRSNPFRTGTQSLLLSYENDRPPREVFADMQFDVSVRIQNTGEYDIPANSLSVSLQGFNHETYGLTQARQTVGREMIGTHFDVDRNIIQGDEEYVVFGPLRYNADLSVTLFGVPIQAVVCYPYGTRVESNLCIKRNPHQDNPGDVCKGNEQKSTFVSSAPVQVTPIRQTPRSNGLAFTFDVVHNGNGEIYGLPSEYCEGREEKNKILVEINGPEGISCGLLGGTNSGVITLGSSGSQITCSLDTSAATSDYVQEISINLKYNYRQQMTEVIDIKPVN